MKKLMLGAAVAGAALLSLRAAARHGCEVCVERCDASCGHNEHGQ